MCMAQQQLEGNIVDLINGSIQPGRIIIEGNRITDIERIRNKCNRYIIPGFVDAHVHVESSMVTPVEFSRMAVRHGTVAAVSDPHEIANVLGEEGIKFMLENGRKTPFKYMFGAPSCVPATPFETAGAVIDANAIRKILGMEGIGFLAEMMNFPGVVNGDPEVMEKIRAARARNVPVDGHAPGLRGERLKKYVNAGITTDHECTERDEALEKLELGMKILIREGSAARNFKKLIPLMETFPESLMFCTDDSHPDTLTKGHINQLVMRAVSLGYDLFNVLRAASFNAVKHYGLNMGLLKVGDPADFVVVQDLKEFRIMDTYIDGVRVYGDREVYIRPVETEPKNAFTDRRVNPSEFRVMKGSNRMHVIQAIDGELITERTLVTLKDREKEVHSDPDHDLLKIAVINRYNPEVKPSVGFVSGFGIRRGALASSIAHDSHHVVCVGVSDRHIAETVQWIFSNQGGIAVHDGNTVRGLPLPIAGLMTGDPVEITGERYLELTHIAGSMGSSLRAPFMTLSFMALLVIPSLKIGDRGLFDVDAFSFTPLFEQQV